MEKENLNVKYLEATIGCPHFEEISKGKNGITLIALIITIIIMAILVGVTVATISDGGMFQKAKIAAEQTEEKTIYEQLVGSIAFGTNGKIEVGSTYSTAEKVLESQGKTVALKSPSTVDEITGEAIIEVTGKSGKTYKYTITTEKIISGELKFYGYGYRVEEGDDFGYYYFLKNGIVITEHNNEVYVSGNYELQGDKIILSGYLEIALSSDSATISIPIAEDYIMVGTRDNNKIFENIGTQDPKYKLYVGSAYCTEDASAWFNVGMDDETNVVNIYNYGTDLNYNGIESFINNGGAEISPDGKTVKFNNKTYYLLER